MADVFISYAREDRGSADELYERIENAGYSAWCDPDLRGGDEWRQVVPNEIRQCRVVIVIWSEHSRLSKSVRMELDEAERLDKPIIPLRVRGFAVDQIPFGFGLPQALLNTAYDQILESLGSYIAAQTATPNPSPGNITPSSVFASARPVQTLVGRSETDEARQLLASIGGVGRLVRFCGPTKSGKTVLIHEALGNFDPIFFSGRRVSNLNAFFTEIAVRLDPALAANPIEALVCLKVAAAKRPIVVDDYHCIPLKTRKAIVSRIQSFLDADIPVILVSWTDIDGDLIAGDPGLNGRAPDPIGISFWRRPDLEKIAHQGFKALNLRPTPFTISLISSHSYNNPFLMHEHCEHFAHACRIVSRPAVETEVAITPEMAISVFKRLCAQTRRNFSRLIEPRGASRFRLVTGESTTEFGLIALGVRRMQPIQAIGMQRLAENVAHLVAEPASINRHTTRDCVDRLMEAFAQSPHRHTALELSAGRLHIHPFFKRFLLWDFAPSKGFGYPAMNNYEDETATDVTAAP